MKYESLTNELLRLYKMYNFQSSSQEYIKMFKLLRMSNSKIFYIDDEKSSIRWKIEEVQRNSTRIKDFVYCIISIVTILLLVIESKDLRCLAQKMNFPASSSSNSLKPAIDLETLSNWPNSNSDLYKTRKIRSIENELDSMNEENKTDEISNLNPGKLRIIRLFSPEAIQNGTQNVTIDCMFKFDKKLDERLTIKWFFNDEVEPIYQWIPELNKRVYSDKYEQFIDKSYQVNEDAEFMLQSYKQLLSEIPTNDQFISEMNPTTNTNNDFERRLNRLSRLMSPNGPSAKEIVETLRNSLAMNEPEFSRFRALRLIAPTTQMAGRFTCSVSSLDGDDLKSTRLLVFEPASSLSFTVSRTASLQPQFNLSCRAGGLFPRPNLTLVRYRAGPASAERPHPSQSQQRQQIQRPRLAATQLRQEPLAAVQTRLTLSSSEALSLPQDLATLNDFTFDEAAGSGERLLPAGEGKPKLFEISSWALVDEASLSTNLITQFECLLTIEGTNYEQRQSLALQRGWHLNSAAAFSSRSTLVGLFGVFISLLCLMLALISSMLIFKLMRRHSAARRVHQETKKEEPEELSSNSTASDGTDSTGADQPAKSQSGSFVVQRPPSIEQTKPNLSMHLNQNFYNEQQGNLSVQPLQSEPDGVYRIPETYGTRFVIGPNGSRQLYSASGKATSLSAAVFVPKIHFQQQQTSIATDDCQIQTNKPLYC